MAGGQSNQDGDVGYQIAPMIDLILVLMVFFMIVVASQQKENELGITLPGKGLSSTQAKESVPIKIGIEADQSINFNDASIASPTEKELDALIAKLQEQVQLFDDKIPVIIAPQPDTPHGRVMDVLNACSAAKIKNVSFEG